MKLSEWCQILDILGTHIFLGKELHILRPGLYNWTYISSFIFQ